MKEENVVIGDLYQHFRGSIYQVVDVIWNATHDLKNVVYVPVGVEGFKEPIPPYHKFTRTMSDFTAPSPEDKNADKFSHLVHEASLCNNLSSNHLLSELLNRKDEFTSVSIDSDEIVSIYRSEWDDGSITPHMPKTLIHEAKGSCLLLISK